jgi:L-ascorbate metabolism protein UlaG (beta-lactamase superfamily)
MIYIIPLLLSYSLMAKVSAKWLGVGTILLWDEHQTLMFDPSFTTPGIFQMMGLEKFASNSGLVKQILKDHHPNKIDGIFITHSHYDHVIDAPEVARQTGATLYADRSVRRIAEAYHDPRIKIQDLKVTQVGKFKVTPYPRKHSQIFQLFDFLPGEVPKDFNFNYYDYKVGETWIYLVEHADGNILIDDSSGSRLALPEKKIRVIFQGIANRRDDQEILEGLVKTFSPEIFIPIHFDNFLRSYPDRKGSSLPFIKFESLEQVFKDQQREIRFLKPVAGEVVELF